MEEKKNNKGVICLIVILIVLVLGLVGYIVYEKVLTNDKSSSQNTTTKSTENSNEKITIDLTKREKLENLLEHIYEVEEITTNEEIIQKLEDVWKIKLEILDDTLNYSYNDGEIVQTINNVKKVLYNILDGSTQTFMLAVITKENDMWFINEQYFADMKLYKYNTSSKEYVKIKPELKKLKNKYSDIKVASLFGGDMSYYIGLSNNEYYDLRNEDKLNNKLSVFLYDDCYLTTDGEIISKNHEINFKYKYGVYNCGVDCKQEYIITDDNYLYQTPIYDVESGKYGDFKKVYNEKINKVEIDNKIIKIYYEDNTIQEFEDLNIMN